MRRLQHHLNGLPAEKNRQSCVEQSHVLCLDALNHRSRASSKWRSQSLDADRHGLAVRSCHLGQDQQLWRLSRILQAHTSRLALKYKLDWYNSKFPAVLYRCLLRTLARRWVLLSHYRNRHDSATSRGVHGEPSHEILAAITHSGCPDRARWRDLLHALYRNHGHILLQASSFCIWPGVNWGLCRRHALPCRRALASTKAQFRLDR